MPDNLSPADRQKTMKAVKGKGTKLERQLWGMLAGMGLNQWRKNANNVTGKPDVVFHDEKIAIFVDGCFWHHCPICNRPLPQTNSEYWEKKITRNVELSTENNQILRNNGWEVIRIWEHEMQSPDLRRNIRSKILHAIEEARR